MSGKGLGFPRIRPFGPCPLPALGCMSLTLNAKALSALALAISAATVLAIMASKLLAHLETVREAM